MGWKQWPYWFKGSGIFFIISFIFNTFSVFYLVMHRASTWGDLSAVIPFTIVNLPVVYLFQFFYNGDLSSNFPFVLVPIVIISLILYSVVGAFIGWIYGKIKDNK